MDKVSIIPKDGKVTAAELYTRKGDCRICGAAPTQLRTHFLLKHASDEERRSFAISMNHVIPVDGNVAGSDVYSGPGICAICDIWISHLRRHFQLQHEDGKTHHPGGSRGTYEVKEIPVDGNVKIAAVYTGPGYCRMPLCVRDVVPADRKFINRNLRDHFLNVHVKMTKKCTMCPEDVLCGSYYHHMESHTGPMQCSVCPVRSDSLQAAKCHIRRNHKDNPLAKPEPMTPDQVKDYQLAKKESRERSEMRRLGRTPITGHKQVLQNYESRLSLRIKSDQLHERAMMLKREFQTLIDIPSDGRMKCNSSFLTIWNPNGNLPSVVFEVVEKTEVYELFDSSQFFPDPKLQHPQPEKREDRLKSQLLLHRGHLAAASNYHLKELVAATYYYSNVVLMHRQFNEIIRQQLEADIREMAEEHGEVKIFHFPLLGDNPEKTDRGFAIPESVANVAIVRKSNGLHMYGWELWNVAAIYDYQQCERYPFSLFEKAGFTFKIPASDFVYLSYDVL